MTTKPPWTDEEKFWRDIRRAVLELVNVIETCKLSEHIDMPTSQVRKRLKSYRRTYMIPPIAAENVRERIAELIVEKAAEEARRALTTGTECDKL